MNQQTSKGTSSASNTSVAKPDEDNASPVTEESNSTIVEGDTVASIRFNDILLSIEGFSIYEDTIYALDRDSVVISSDSINDEPYDEVKKIFLQPSGGGTIQGIVIRINSTTLSDVTIETRYETSPMILGEGEYCTLYNWKSYYSEWKFLKQVSATTFVCPEYSLADHEKFIDVDMNELKKALKEKCGNGYYEKIKDVSSPTEYPCAIRISRYFLRVSGVSKESGKKVVKYITMEVVLI